MSIKELEMDRDDWKKQFINIKKAQAEKVKALKEEFDMPFFRQYFKINVLNDVIDKIFGESK